MPERFRRGNEYPENAPRASTILPPGGVNPLYAQNSQNRDIYLVSLITDQPKSSTPSSTTKSSTTTTTTTTTTSTEPKTSSRRALPRVTTTKALPSPKAPSGGGSKRELSVSSFSLSNVEWHVTACFEKLFRAAEAAEPNRCISAATRATKQPQTAALLYNVVESIIFRKFDIEENTFSFIHFLRKEVKLRLQNCRAVPRFSCRR
jgi:hypothetical protein